MAREEHAARNWVESKFPSATGSYKAALILAYGCGMDAGFAEAQQIIDETIQGYRIDPVAVITDMGAFDRQTAALRDAGFTKEADSRDKYAHPKRVGGTS